MQTAAPAAVKAAVRNCADRDLSFISSLSKHSPDLSSFSYVNPKCGSPGTCQQINTVGMCLCANSTCFTLPNNVTHLDGANGSAINVWMPGISPLPPSREPCIGHRQHRQGGKDPQDMTCARVVPPPHVTLQRSLRHTESWKPWPQGGRALTLPSRRRHGGSLAAGSTLSTPGQTRGLQSPVGARFGGAPKINCCSGRDPHLTRA